MVTVMKVFKNENGFLETRDKIVIKKTPAMIRVMCPLRAGCPIYGGNELIGKNKRCYGRLFDLAETNGVGWFRYRCQHTKKIIVMKQMGLNIIFWDEDPKKDKILQFPKDFREIRCPACGNRLLDTHQEDGRFVFEIKCPTDKNIIIWYGASNGRRGYNDENANCA